MNESLSQRAKAVSNAYATMIRGYGTGSGYIVSNVTRFVLRGWGRNRARLYLLVLTDTMAAALDDHNQRQGLESAS